MLLSEFDYNLPSELIASEPASPRTAARMLDMRGSQFIDRHVSDLPECLKAGDVLVVNNTKVLKARLTGRRGEAKIELTLHRRLDDSSWLGFAKPAKKLRLGDEVVFSDRLKAEVNSIGEDGERGLIFNHSGKALDAMLEATGSTPLPPYIPRPDGIRDDDASDYQTIFARHSGAVAAPTAGLHFTPELQADLTKRGIGLAEITLHVGAGTFLPVKVDDVRNHKMHSEWGQITPAAADLINATKANGGRVVAVGTTSLRILESCHQEHGDIRPYQAETDLFIIPGFTFKAVDLLLTNFHLPKSTLLMLVSAFTGVAHVRSGYAHAIAGGYRFFSYGDSCLMECRHE